MPARRRSAPTVRFKARDTLVTGVRAFECAFNARTSSLVHGLITRRAVFGAFAAFTFFAGFFATLGIHKYSITLQRASNSLLGELSQARLNDALHVV
jgi:hypothetical protein